jgi:hypothetical protein
MIGGSFWWRVLPRRWLFLSFVSPAAGGPFLLLEDSGKLELEDSGKMLLEG